MGGRAQLSRSADLYGRAQGLMPGGVNSPVRAMRAIGRDPVFVARGEGAELIDVDGAPVELGGAGVPYPCSASHRLKSSVK